MAPDTSGGRGHQESEGSRPLRILEVGNHDLFATAAPDQTDYFHAGHKRSRHRSMGPVAFFEVLRKLRRREYDLVVLHAARFAPWNPRLWLPLFRDRYFGAYPHIFSAFAWRMLHRFHDVPVVAIDLADTFGVGRHNNFLLDHAVLFFKRELPADRWQVFFKSGHWNLPGRRWRRNERNRRRMEKLRPLSYGPGTRRVPTRIDAPKTADLFFAGELGSTPRQDCVVELEALAAEGYRIDYSKEWMERSEFLRRMASAWLALSPSGYGWDCARHYEAPAVGTVPLMNYPTILRDMPLIEGEHCLFYAPEPGGLTAAVRAALADKARLATMAEAAHAHLHAHHTAAARAERIAVAVLGRRLDGSEVT